MGLSWKLKTGVSEMVNRITFYRKIKLHTGNEGGTVISSYDLGYLAIFSELR